MKSRIIKVFSILMITIMTCTVLNTKAYAWNIGDLGMEENIANIMPSTDNPHLDYRYGIDLPTGSGSLFVRFQDAYFDTDEEYGYPTSIRASMDTNVICDFSIDICGYDQFDIAHYCLGGSSQAYSCEAYCKCDSSSSLWSHADGEVWVCDDEGEGKFY